MKSLVSTIMIAILCSAIFGMPANAGNVPGDFRPLRKTYVELKVNGIGLGATYAQVIRTFGKPISEKTKDAGECVGGLEKTLRYPGLEVRLYGDDAKSKFTVGDFEVSSAKWNVSGVKVGAIFMAVKKRFGKSDQDDMENGERILSYEMDDNKGPGSSSFHFRKGKLVRIYTMWLMC